MRQPWIWRVIAVIAVLLLAADYRLRPDPGINARAMLEPTELDAFLLRQSAATAVLYWPASIASPIVAKFQFEQVAEALATSRQRYQRHFPRHFFFELNRNLQGPRDAT